ncbi:unnamed protein product [Auanema sp. JU1783]|nr:unnamed protein product [Auanema sp. JU1783]
MDTKKIIKKAKTKVFDADVTIDEEVTDGEALSRKKGRTKSASKERCSNAEQKPQSERGKQIEQMLQNFVNNITDQGINGMRNLFKTELSPYTPNRTFKSWNANKVKNRYQDIFCFDESRIKLTFDVPPQTDYIHANWVKFDGHERSYIACQGPMANTVEDFWRMVLQEQTTRIMNLTKNVENGKVKCHQYWPENAGDYQNYGKIFVHTKKFERINEGIDVYTIEVLPEGCSNSTLVKLIHVTNWPDKGNPLEGRDVLRILRVMSTADTPRNDPIAVHCSAGIGRTGTLILIDVVLQKLFKCKEPVDLVKIFRTIRDQRSQSILKEGQFLFAISSILEYLDVCDSSRI